jgi:hypothetical protein
MFLAVVYWSWRTVLMTGTHGQIAMLLLPLLVFGLISGIFMHRFKKKRTVLPLIHGLNNLLVILFVLSGPPPATVIFNDVSFIGVLKRSFSSPAKPGNDAASQRCQSFTSTLLKDTKNYPIKALLLHRLPIFHRTPNGSSMTSLS